MKKLIKKWLGLSEYKVYSALLSQVSTDAPTAIILENTLGNLWFNYTGVGQYEIKNDANLFKNDKTFLIIQGSHDGDINSAIIIDKLYYKDSNTINCIVGAGWDGLLNKTSIEIRVYN